MVQTPHSTFWRGWLLLAVALWMSFAPAAIAAGVPRFFVEPASVGGEESSAGPGLHIYLYANGSPIMFSDPSGHLLVDTRSAAATGFVISVTVRIVAPRIVISAATVFQVLIAAAIFEGARELLTSPKGKLIDEDLRAEGKTKEEFLLRLRKKSPPIFFDPIVIWKEVARHDGYVQSLNPGWRVLHVGPRLGAAEFADINRKESMEASGLPARGDMDRHEYPFASTLEGGAKALSTYTDPGRNRSQGRALAAFYALHGLKVGDPFLVLVLP